MSLLKFLLVPYGILATLRKNTQDFEYNYSIPLWTQKDMFSLEYQPLQEPIEKYYTMQPDVMLCSSQDAFL